MTNVARPHMEIDKEYSSNEIAEQRKYLRHKK